MVHAETREIGGKRRVLRVLLYLRYGEPSVSGITTSLHLSARFQN